MSFCSNCGAPLKPTDKFCNNCGAAAGGASYQAAAPPPPMPQMPPQYNPYQQAPPQSYEQIRGMLDNYSTGFPVKIYNAFFTDRRIIFAKIGRFQSMFTTGMAASGGLVGGLIGAGLDATVNRGRKKKSEQQAQMTPDMLLAEAKVNFDIQYAQIQSVEMKKPGMMQQAWVTIHTPGKKHKFNLQMTKDKFQTHINLFQTMLPGRVIVK